MWNRRQFCLSPLAAGLTAGQKLVHTVRGPVAVDKLGSTLMHEHVLVNFTGAPYDRDEAFRVALPELQDLHDRGCRTLVECTPKYIGRDVELLRRLSVASDLHILTNTGYYAAAGDKYLPEHAWREPAHQIAQRWITEANDGIDGIRPAFLKLGVDAGPLSEIDAKLIGAGILCHKQTRLRLHVHTGNGEAAQGILALLRRSNVDPSAYVWVHAQNEKDRDIHLHAARAGAWIELDGVNAKSMEAHAAAVLDLIGAGFGQQVLISQDSGWYRPGEPGGGLFNGFTFLFDTFVPALRKHGLSDEQIQMLLVENPARALTT
jgi:predicted metal-dependent phosphotriesterase family hydrolase